MEVSGASAPGVFQPYPRRVDGWGRNEPSGCRSRPAPAGIVDGIASSTSYEHTQQLGRQSNKSLADMPGDRCWGRWCGDRERQWPLLIHYRHDGRRRCSGTRVGSSDLTGPDAARPRGVDQVVSGEPGL